MISAILLAAGSGKRMGLGHNKIFIPLGPYSVIQWNLIHMAQCANIDEVIIVTTNDELQHIKQEVASIDVPFLVKYALGGKERQDSVQSGIQELHGESQIVLVHDGARPMASPKLFIKVIENTKIYGAVVPAIPVVDTIKTVNDEGTVGHTLNRSELRAMQTPQGFHRHLLEKAYQWAYEHDYIGTDDVSLVEYMGETVMTIEGERENIKITTPEDVKVSKLYLGVQPMMRVGYGYDIHTFSLGRPCILGGVSIDSPIGPDGHSDADVLLHALMDALLGAAGLRDIGYYFPPEDETYKGISSRLLLEKVVQLLKDSNFGVYNVDIMVIAEAPKLKPHIERMKENISQDLSIPVNRISIKATTNEGLGALGRTEGIAAQAVVTVYEREEL